LKTKIAILGIGNRLKRDDGAGSILAENLSLRGLTSFDSAVVPENFTGALRKAAPDTLIIVDACAMGLKPGEFRKIALKRIDDEDTFSSHSPGIIELISYIGEFIPEIIFIGIEPESMDFGEGLNPEVQDGIKILEEIIFSGKFHLIDTA
jgi:hydrogenase 3 maturation protease